MLDAVQERTKVQSEGTHKLEAGNGNTHAYTSILLRQSRRLLMLEVFFVPIEETFVFK